MALHKKQKKDDHKDGPCIVCGQPGKVWSKRIVQWSYLQWFIADESFTACAVHHEQCAMNAELRCMQILYGLDNKRVVIIED